MKRVLCVIGLLLLFSTPVFAIQDAHTIDLYRMYNPQTQEHLYSSDFNEAVTLFKNGWNQESNTWRALIDYGTPVFRLFDHISGAHLYTSDVNEINVLSQSTWSVDNNNQPVFYSYGRYPVYRLFSPITGQHLLTCFPVEYNTLGAQGWIQEGVSMQACVDHNIFALDLGYPDSLTESPIDPARIYDNGSYAFTGGEIIWPSDLMPNFDLQPLLETSDPIIGSHVYKRN